MGANAARQVALLGRVAPVVPEKVLI